MTNVDFAAAQARVAARRSARDAASIARYDRNRADVARSRVPQALQRPAANALSWWDMIRSREGTRPAFRVGQVDAELLDEELLGLMKEQVGEALKYYGSHLREDWTAEIQLALRAILFKLTVWDHDASYGASLQNLRFTDARRGAQPGTRPSTWQKSLYGLLSVGGRYAWTKWEGRLLDIEAGYEEPSPLMKRLSRFSSLASTSYTLAAFVSFLVFLINGRYRTILDRVLRLQLLPTTSQVTHEVSFEYLNRQLVWHAFTEFLLFLLPLVGVSRWKRLLARAWRKMRGLFTSAKEEDDTIPGGELGFLPERTCAICYQDQNPTATSEGDALSMSANTGGVIGSASTDITSPYETVPCGCIYDFVCLAQRLDAEDGEGWTCLRCGELVRECRPWHGDVVQERSRASSSGKSVSFADETVDESFVKLEPIPDEDGREAEIEEEIKQESVRRASMDDAVAWDREESGPDGDDSFLDGDMPEKADDEDEDEDEDGNIDPASSLVDRALQHDAVGA